MTDRLSVQQVKAQLKAVTSFSDQFVQNLREDPRK